MLLSVSLRATTVVPPLHGGAGCCAAAGPAMDNAAKTISAAVVALCLDADVPFRGAVPVVRQLSIAALTRSQEIR
ncbi:MAG: hypothetical protein R3D62_13970 [Xanthobacteraceae bacterium]